MIKDRLHSLVGLVIADNEKDKLLKLCEEYDIPILYPSLFKDTANYHLWGISGDGVGLLGVEVIRRLPKIIHGVDELREFTKMLEDKYDFHVNEPVHEYGCDHPPYLSTCPWIFANIEGHSYQIGVAGVQVSPLSVNRWLNGQDFLTILDIVYRSDVVSKEE